MSSRAALIAVLLLSVPAVRAADKEAIDRAVQRGVAYLRGQQDADGSWPAGPVGATALAGLTLLECGVAADDPAVVKAGNSIRQAAPGLRNTYSASLALLFLDRLGGPGDKPLIATLTARLLAGQTARGGWSYDLPEVTADELRRFRPGDKTPGGAAPAPAAPPRGKPGLPPNAPALPPLPMLAERGLLGLDDNSNTQFATIALWVARRHDLPVDAALGRVNQRFRTTQNPDGGWDYMGRSTGARGQSTATMTCAGLLGLAVAHGVGPAALRTAKPNADADAAAKAVDPTNDPLVKSGLVALGSAIGNAPDPTKAARRDDVAELHAGRLYYFLWSLERVAVAYGLNTIGKKDWYGWGAEVLLARQDARGSWTGQFAVMHADTCFALLFLRRANLAPDLTAKLKGKVSDPSEVALASGGVGGSGLQRLGLKSVLDADDGSGSGGSTPTGRGATSKPRAAAPPPRPTEKKAPTEEEAEAERLSRRLVSADGDKFDKTLDTMRDARGAAYTEALADAIPRIEGEAKKKVRDALAERLSRMTRATLADRLGDDRPEVRRAAALAAAMKEEKDLVDRLIGLLDDKERDVVKAAHAALKSLTGQDIAATDPAKWRAWAKEQRR